MTTTSQDTTTAASSAKDDDSKKPDNPIEKLDVDIAHAAARVKHRPVVRAATLFSEIADQAPMFAICGATIAVGLLARNRRLARTGLHMALAEAGATVLKTGLKMGIARTRPHRVIDGEDYEVEVNGPTDGPHNSFPSGHMAGATAVADVVARAYPRLAPAAWLLTGLIGTAQVPKGAHYPTDVLIGGLVGKMAGLVVDRVLPEVTPESGVEATRPA